MSRISYSTRAPQAEAIRPIQRIFHTYQSPQAEVIRLGCRIGAGAEGVVFEILDRSDLVAKIYHEPPPPEKAEKLIALSRLGSDRLFNLSAWPVDALRNGPDGPVAGFLMKKISQAEEVHALHSPKSRLQKFPEASWEFLIYVAANIARAVAAIHEHGFVIGDVNPKNILVTRKATVYLLDVDSFQVTADGTTYRCEGGFPEYTPPELQGMAFRDLDRRQEHDYFGLAVVIFQLLFLGRHPFSGRFLGAVEMPLERAIREFRFAFGADAEVRKMRQPPGTLALDSMPSELVDLFRRAFLTADRPRPGEWVEPLEVLAKSLKKCSLHSGHHYYSELRDCPWCGIEMRARVRLFNFPLSGASSQRGYFRLDDIWNEIESIEAPDTPLVPNDRLTKALEPSADVAAAARRRKGDLITAIIFTALLSFVIALVTSFPVSLALLIPLLVIARKISGADQISLDDPLTLFQSQNSIPDDPVVQKVRSRHQKAEGNARWLQEQYDREAGNARWAAKRDELRNRKETYENLELIRDFKFKQLTSTAREQQFVDFLGQHEIDRAEIEDLSSGIKTYLRSYGVETAADVTKQKLRHIPVVGKSQSKRLLDWRRDLERKFVFNPGEAISPEARIKVEREIDELRFRLEHDLTDGAHSLYRIKQTIETSRQKLQPALIEARRELAQAEKDWQDSIKRYSLRPILFAMGFAFFLGISLQAGQDRTEIPVLPHDDINGINRERRAPPPPPPPPPVYSPESANAPRLSENREALSLYYQGVNYSEKGRFKDAVAVLTKAVEIDPSFSEAYKELGYAQYRLKKYDESINASRQAILLYADFEPYYNMGLAYMARKNWLDASDAFERAIAYCKADSWNEKYSNAYYYSGLSLARLGAAEAAIEALEKSLVISPEMTLGRFELATLYLGSGKNKEAREQYKILKEVDPALAEELRKLMKKHGIRTPA